MSRSGTPFAAERTPVSHRRPSSAVGSPIAGLKRSLFEEYNSLGLPSNHKDKDPKKVEAELRRKEKEVANAASTSKVAKPAPLSKEVARLASPSKVVAKPATPSKEVANVASTSNVADVIGNVHANDIFSTCKRSDKVDGRTIKLDAKIPYYIGGCKGGEEMYIGADEISLIEKDCDTITNLEINDIAAHLSSEFQVPGTRCCLFKKVANDQADAMTIEEAGDTNIPKLVLVCEDSATTATPTLSQLVGRLMVDTSTEDVYVVKKVNKATGSTKIAKHNLKTSFDEFSRTHTVVSPVYWSTEKNSFLEYHLYQLRAIYGAILWF